MAFELKSQKDDDDDYYYFEGYASTYNNVDLGDDVVMEGAFDNTMKTKKPNNIKILYQHDMRMPLGIATEFRDDKNGFFIRAKMPKEHSQAKDVMALMKCGAIDSMSIGYIPVKFDYDDRGTRLLKEIDLHEVSLVTMPMNPKAMITAMKAVTPAKDLPVADKDRKWSTKLAVQRIKSFTNSIDKPSANYKRAFMYFDMDDVDNFGAYKLPFADVVNGKLMAIPSAVMAIAAILKGEKGAVNISQEDVAKIKNTVNHYFEKMGMDLPFDKSIPNDDYEDVEDEEENDGEKVEDEYYDDLDFIVENSPRGKSVKKFYVEDIKNITTKRQFERCLRESGAFSVEAAKKLTALFNPLSELKGDDMAKQFEQLTEILNRK